MNDQYAAMILGQNWEAEILSGRLDTLNQFKDKYVRIQDQISKAAWQSANAQIDAQTEAEKGSKGTKGSATISAGTTVSSDLSSMSPSAYELYDTRTGQTLASGFLSEEEARKHISEVSAEAQGKEFVGIRNATSSVSPKSHYELYNVKTGQTLASGFDSNEEAAKHINDVASEAQGREFVKIRKYHKGLEEGYVGNASKDEKLELLQKAGNGSLAKELSSKEVPAILQEGEVVVNQKQQDEMNELVEGFLKYVEERLKEPFNMAEFLPDHIYETQRRFQQELKYIEETIPKGLRSKLNSEPITVNIGDIQLQNVQHPDSLADAIIKRFPISLSQRLHYKNKR